MSKKELEVGIMYKCVLSGLNVLIIEKTESEFGISVLGVYFNQNTQTYVTIDVGENQLVR